MATKLGEGNRVEGAGGRRFSQPQLAEAMVQFARCFAGERKCENSAWIERVGHSAVGDTAGENAGLARPCTCTNNELGRVDRDGPVLLLV